MADSNEELTNHICDALRADGLIGDGIDIELAAAVLSGKIKAEDWYSMIERSLPKQQGATDGN